METHPGEGVIKEKFPNTRKPSYRWVCGEFWNLRGHITGRKKQNPQITRLTAAPSGEVAQRLVFTTSKPGLNREVWTALLRVSTRPECPEGNLRELT